METYILSNHHHYDHHQCEVIPKELVTRGKIMGVALKLTLK